MGTIALVGGEEFLPESISIDRELLARAAGYRPWVAILPTAAAGGDPLRIAERGVHHFEALGAEARAVMVLTRSDAEEPGKVRELREADLIYLAGGDPWYLLETLRNSPLLDTLFDLYHQGCIVAGSGGAAMVLAERMRDRASWNWVEAMGFAERVAVLPNHERFPRAQIDPPRHGLAPHIALLGIDSATACISYKEKVWELFGAGRVTVYSTETTLQYEAGESIFLS